MVVLSSLICAYLAIGASQVRRVVQNSAPGEIVPTTPKLMLLHPVSDGAVTLELFRLQGEGVEWSPDGRWVAYDSKSLDGYYNIHVCRPDGTGDRCLTALDNGLPHRHAGSPTWDASGQYIAFAAEKKEHRGGRIEAIPGFGGRSDIWVMKSDGSRAWQLTHTADTKDAGVIIPKFSHDGKELAWTERIGAPKLLRPSSGFGDWVIKVADFRESPTGPTLANVRTFQPGARGFYEAYGFSPDDRRIIFCSNLGRGSSFFSKIYLINASDGGGLTCLTPERSYNEHASFSPDGKQIVWMTNVDNPSGGTDWWIMRSNGTAKRRLTHFNQPGYPESTQVPVYACLSHWSPDGRQLLAGAQYSLIKQEGRIFLLTFH